MAVLFKNLIFTVLVPGTAAVYAPIAIAGRRALSPGHGLALVFGGALLAAGAAVYAWCVWDFATFGRGTPAPIDAPRKLVVRGLYRRVRNPMYVGVLTAIAGWAVLYRSAAMALYGVCVGTIFHLFVVRYEEPNLARVFGRDYALYVESAGRWLPRIRSGPRGK